MNEETKQKSAMKRLGEHLPTIVVVVLLLLLTWAGYLRFVKGWGWADWTEFGEYTDPTGVYHREKTLWDLLELLIIPIVLALGAWWLNKSEKENEREIADKRRKEDRRIAEENRQQDREIADDRRNQTTLEAYFDRMTELLLEKGLRESEEGDEVRSIARTRTLAVLRSLDGNRKGQVVQFLCESGLIGPNLVAVLLNGANLRRADLRGADLRGADLRETTLWEADLIKANLYRANLHRADLSGAELYWTKLIETKLDGARLHMANLCRADLSGADLSGANLSETDLHEVDLSGANLREAYLAGAKVTDERLAQAASLKGATLPDGKKLNEENWQAEFDEWRNEQDWHTRHANLKKAQVTDEQLSQAASLAGATLPDGTKVPDEETAGEQE